MLRTIVPFLVSPSEEVNCVILGFNVIEEMLNSTDMNDKATAQPMSKLAESHSEMEFYFIHFGQIRSCGGSHLGPVIKDTTGFHSK